MSPLKTSFFLIAALALSFFLSFPRISNAGDEILLKAKGIGTGTLNSADPVYTGGGEFRYAWPLLNPGGPMDLNFTLTYVPDMGSRMPVNTGRHQFPPWYYTKAFQSNTIIRMVEAGETVSSSRYVNVMLYDDTHVFEEDGSGGYDPVGPIRFQVKKINNYFYLMDPRTKKVYIFDGSAAGYNMAGQYNHWSGEAAYIFDRNGNRLSYTYNVDNLPTSISDGLGRSLTFTYIAGELKANRHISSVSDGFGRSISFTYADCNSSTETKLHSFIDARGKTTSFQYSGEECYLLSKINNPLGNSHISQTWTTNPKGENAINSQDDAYANRTDFSYSQDPQNNIIVTTDYPDSGQRVYHHKNERYPLDVTDPAAKQFSVNYNSNDQPTAITDRLGDGTTMSYHSASGYIASYTNANGHTISHTYSAQFQGFVNPDNSDAVTFTFYNRTRTDYPDSTFETFSYDGIGNMTGYTGRTGQTTTYTYNGLGQILTVTNPAGGVATYTYNSDGTLATSTDSDTAVGTTTYGYNSHKRLNLITRPGNSTVQITYNENDQVTSVTDENSNTYGFAYDDNGNRTMVTDPAAKQTVYGYDLMDRISQVSNRLSKITTFSYDNMGQINQITDPTSLAVDYSYNTRGWNIGKTIGGQTWQTGHDDEGVVSSRTTPLGYSTAFQTDRLGHTTGITDPLSRTTTFTRDSMARITAGTDPLSRTTNYSYDARGLVSGVTLPVAGAAASYTRNDMGLLSRITDLNSQNWTFGYTNMGRLQSGADPLGNTWQHTYDTRGRLDRTTYPDTQTMTRTYDNAGNITRRLYSGGLDLQYTYDGLDRLVTVNGIAFTRDAEGRVTATDNPSTIFGATYDDGGRLATATYNNGAFTVTYTYESSTGLLSRVTDSLTNTQIDFSYDNDGRRTGITRSNGVNAAFTYDNAARLTRIQDGSIIDIQYTLDAAGQVTRADTTVPLDPASLLVSETNTFTYDAASQVSSAGYTYDSRGRQTAAAGHTYTWDNASRLTGIDGVTLVYNGLDDLTARTEGAAAIHYYYNYAIGLKPIAAEKDQGTEQFLRYYVWTPGGRLLYMIDSANNNKAYFYHFNRTGSTLALTDSTGAVTDSYAYTPYGELLQHNGASEQPFTFVGAWGVRQETPTIYHMRARYYDSATARFISRDPIWPVIKNPKTINPYQYAAANPVSNIDPGGMWMGRLVRWGARQLGGEAVDEIMPDYEEWMHSEYSPGSFIGLFLYTSVNPDELIEFAAGEYAAEYTEKARDEELEAILQPQREDREAARLAARIEAERAEMDANWANPERERIMLEEFLANFGNDPEKESLLARVRMRLCELARARHQGNRETPSKATSVLSSRPTHQSDALLLILTGAFATHPEETRAWISGWQRGRGRETLQNGGQVCR